MARTQPIVALDGPSGAGKSTVSRMLAAKLGYLHVDTGALYRAVGLAATRAGVAYDDDAGLEALLGDIQITLEPAEPQSKVLLNGEDVSGDIRTNEISNAASAVSARASVRAGLLDLQRTLGGTGASVLEGRDIGTVVFPDAEAKIWLDASVQERAFRRHAELQSRGVEVALEEVERQITERDHNDSTRALAPSKPAEGAFHLDTTGLSIDQVVDKLAMHVQRIAQTMGK